MVKGIKVRVYRRSQQQFLGSEPQADRTGEMRQIPTFRRFFFLNSGCMKQRPLFKKGGDPENGCSKARD